MELKNIPVTIQWFLAFSNLGRKPGVLNPPLGAIEKLKRQPELSEELRSGGLVFDEYDPNIKRTHNGWLYYVARNKEPIFCGKDMWEFYPTLDEFKQFFLIHGLPYIGKRDTIKFKSVPPSPVFASWELSLNTGKVSVLTHEGKELIISPEEPRYHALESKSHVYLVMDMWRPMLKFFEHITKDPPDIVRIKEFITAIYKKYSSRVEHEHAPMQGVHFKHDCALPIAIYASVLDFWYNHFDVHKRLRSCPCCGMFYVKDEKNKRGRPIVFCNEKCETRFNQQSSPASI